MQVKTDNPYEASRSITYNSFLLHGRNGMLSERTQHKQQHRDNGLDKEEKTFFLKYPLLWRDEVLATGIQSAVFFSNLNFMSLHRISQWFSVFIIFNKESYGLSSTFRPLCYFFYTSLWKQVIVSNKTLEISACALT